MNISKQEPIKGYKIFNSDWTCRDKQYKLGETFHEEEVELCNRGMHFCTKLEDCFDYYDFNISLHVAKVEGYGTVDYSTEDSKVAVSDLKITKELTLKDSKQLRKAINIYYNVPESLLMGIASEEEQLEAVKRNGFSIKYIKNPSEEVQLEAVKYGTYTIKYIKNPSERVQIESVKRNGCSIQYINNRSEEVQLEAVKQDGHSIQFIKNPSKRLQLEAVKQNGNSIQYINTPSKEVQLEAVKHDAYDLKYINNPYLLVRMANIWYKLINKFK